jgi:hypothetical protein
MNPKRRKQALLLMVLFSLITIVPSARAEEAVRLEVRAFVDFNGDKLISAGEGIENAAVIITAGERSQTKLLEKGKATFSLPYLDVEAIQVEIPYLALGEEAKPKDGQALVQFRLDAPELPVYLP